MWTSYLTARGARWRTSCVRSEKMPHAQPVLHSRRAQQFAEAGLKIATDNSWHESAREPMEKMPHLVVLRIGLIAERRARTYFVRHPWNDINLS
jgi:hypothetical protein